MKTLLPLAAAALSLSACAPSPIVDSAPVRQDGQAMLGQPTRVGGLVVTPQQLVEDSRCPMNARCVWAGRVVLKARVDGPGWRDTVDLTLGQPRPVRTGSVTLTSVRPDKLAGQAVPPEAYLFGFTGGL